MKTSRRLVIVPKLTPVSGIPILVSAGMNVKGERRWVLEILSRISIERACRELPIDMVIHRSIFKK